ncbi:MAG: hypothetical protein AB9846_05845 [Tenuifilaceae bacterium]
MKWIKQSNISILLVSVFFSLIYLFLPSNNNSIDAWGFASYVKQGESLFLSHHLFYNVSGYLWVQLIGLVVNVDTLKLLIILNALFAAATLYILGITLKRLNVEVNRILVWVAFAGSSWGIMRYATENETYIIPLFFSLLGSYFFVKSLKESKVISFFFSGFFAALACLFHQIMFFWWLSLVIGIAFRKKFTPVVWFALPAFLVPISYILVLIFYYNQPISIETFLHFVFRDYYSGSADVSIGLGGFMLTGISIIRTFFQVHGYLAFLPQISFWFIAAGLVSVVLLTVGVFNIKGTTWTLIKLKEQTVWIHLVALILQLFFAFLSNGNAEFLVMIPILLVLILSQITQKEVRMIGFLSAGMLIWNISFGLIPLNNFSVDSNRFVSEKVLESQTNQKKSLFIVFNKPAVENRVKYYTGNYPKNVISGFQFNDIKSAQERIILALEGDTIVITDCINRPKTLSRETILIQTNANELFFGFETTMTDSVETLSGNYFLYRISTK